jgi:hypothetical protein
MMMARYLPSTLLNAEEQRRRMLAELGQQQGQAIGGAASALGDYAARLQEQKERGERKAALTAAEEIAKRKEERDRFKGTLGGGFRPELVKADPLPTSRVIGGGFKQPSVPMMTPGVVGAVPDVRSEKIERTAQEQIEGERGAQDEAVDKYTRTFIERELRRADSYGIPREESEPAILDRVRSVQSNLATIQEKEAKAGERGFKEVQAGIKTGYVQPREEVEIDSEQARADKLRKDIEYIDWKMKDGDRAKTARAMIMANARTPKDQAAAKTQGDFMDALDNVEAHYSLLANQDEGLVSDMMSSMGTGPWSDRLGRLNNYLGVVDRPEYDGLRAAVNTLVGLKTRADSGLAASDAERLFIAQQLPNMASNDATFRQMIQTWRSLGLKQQYRHLLLESRNRPGSDPFMGQAPRSFKVRDWRTGKTATVSDDDRGSALQRVLEQGSPYMIVGLSGDEE